MHIAIAWPYVEFAFVATTSIFNYVLRSDSSIFNIILHLVDYEILYL